VTNTTRRLEHNEAPCEATNLLDKLNRLLHINGNSNGILIQPGASGNTMRQNIVAGNPPSQVSRTYGPIGFDIKDEAATNGARNTLTSSCLTKVIQRRSVRSAASRVTKN
jgi:hypothetical protein